MNIALVAHDGRKKELAEWVKYNAHLLMEHQLYATGTTAKVLRETLKSLDDPKKFPLGEEEMNRYYEQKIVGLLSGPAGGDAQIGAMIAEGNLDMLIFFCDNLIVQGHQNDVSALTRLASLYNIAFATNRTTADMLLTSPLMTDTTYKRIIPKAITDYVNRKL